MTYRAQRACGRLGCKGAVGRPRRRPVLAAGGKSNIRRCERSSVSSNSGKVNWAAQRWPRFNLKSFRRFSLGIIVLTPVLYFFPIPTIFYLVCGALDVSRQKNVTVELIEKYFTG